MLNDCILGSYHEASRSIIKKKLKKKKKPLCLYNHPLAGLPTSRNHSSNKLQKITVFLLTFIQISVFWPQFQVQTSPWNFKWGKYIQWFQRYAFRKVWTQFVPNLTSFWPMGKPIWGKWPWQCTTTGLDNSTELQTVKIHQAVTEIWVPQVWQPPAHPPGPWWQYPSSPEDWGVKIKSFDE